MPKLIFDAGPLITSCKFSAVGKLVIDHLLACYDITISHSVQQEVVTAGATYRDAKAAQERIDAGLISVLSPPSNPALETLIAPYKLGKGEQDSLLLLGHPDLKHATLVVDDHLAYLVGDRLQLHKRFLLDVLITATIDGTLTNNVAIDIVKSIQTRYPLAFVAHTLLLLEQ